MTASGKQGIALAISPDGQLLATAAQDGLVRLWHLASRNPLATLRGHATPVRTLEFSPDGSTIVSCGVDQTLKVWDAGASALASSNP